MRLGPADSENVTFSREGKAAFQSNDVHADIITSVKRSDGDKMKCFSAALVDVKLQITGLKMKIGWFLLMSLALSASLLSGSSY